MVWTNLPPRMAGRPTAIICGLSVVAAMCMVGPAARAEKGVANAPKIYVFPIQPVFADVPGEIPVQVGDLLKKEIKQNDELTLQKGPIFVPEGEASQAVKPDEADLAKAEQLRKAGEDQVQRLQLEKATRTLKAALDSYEKALVVLPDLNPIVQTALLLSVCHYRSGREDQGQELLEKVARLQPDLQLDPEKYPPMFRNTLDQLRQKLLRKTRGQVEVLSNAPGATVYFNGRDVGQTPIVLKELVPGEHYLRVEKEGLQTWAGKVNVVSTQKKRVLATLGGVKQATGPLGRIADGIRSNRLDTTAIKNVQEQGKKIGADFVVLGGVARSNKAFSVGSWLVKVSDGGVCPLPAVQLDADLLGASVEIYNLTSDMVKKTEACPQPARAPIEVVAVERKAKVAPTAVAVGPAIPSAAPAKPAPEQGASQPAKPGTAAPAVPGTVAPAKPAVATPAAPGTVAPAKPAVATPAAPGTVAPVKPAVATPAAPPSPAKPAAADRQAVAKSGPAKPGPVVTTDEGLATTSGSAIQPLEKPVAVVPQVAVAQPIDDLELRESRWYESWWFWTLVGVAVLGGTAGGLYAAGVFDGETTGGSVTVTWPN